MSMPFVSETVFSPSLTPVRLATTANVEGSYYNGPNNNGVFATLTISASSLTIDNVVCVVGDRILLLEQDLLFQNGVYVVFSIDPNNSKVVLQRASDQQNIEQIKSGQYVSIAAGDANAGGVFTLVEPKPLQLGVSPMLFKASGPNGIFKVTPTLTPDQLMSMYESPILLLPAPGPKESFFALFTLGAYDFVTTPYDANAGSIVAQIGNAPHGAGLTLASYTCTGFTDQVVSTFAFGDGGGSTVVSDSENQAVYLSNTVAPLTGGDDPVTLNMLFMRVIV